MRTYIKKLITKEETIVKDIFCDMCGRQFGESIVFGERIEDVKFVYGESYPDYDLQEGFIVEDLCSECSKKIRKILEENGVKTKDYERFW